MFYIGKLWINPQSMVVLLESKLRFHSEVPIHRIGNSV